MVASIGLQYLCQREQTDSATAILSFIWYFVQGMPNRSTCIYVLKCAESIALIVYTYMYVSVSIISVKFLKIQYLIIDGC